MKVRMFATSLIVSGLSLLAVPAFANSKLEAAYNTALQNCNTISNLTARGRCQLNAEQAYRNEVFSNSLTPRQRSFDIQIGNIYRDYLAINNQVLPVNRTTVIDVMRAIGANPNEVNEVRFVVNRMVANHKAYTAGNNVLDGIDATINSLQRTLQP
jgi:hypothetical protein